jgi:EAL domain-containing protein (putative c-di-GMP-specific phosphodiesterase class I)
LALPLAAHFSAQQKQRKHAVAWSLETVAADGSRVSYDVATLPFRIGRDPTSDLVVAALGLSRHHAELTEDISGGLRLADLGSTNGTYVNRERITGARLLAENDVLHFGNAEFRLNLVERTASYVPNNEQTVIVPKGKALSHNFVQRERQFMDLLAGVGLAVAAQPIVDANGGAIRAYELLGRCTHPELPASPIQLFSLAATLGREAELSEAFRNLGVMSMAPRLVGEALFVNAHPKETFDERFLGSLQKLRDQLPQVTLIVEVHESAVTESARMRELAARLADMDMRFAYDDFGAGQARLNEIGDVPAYCVKFDMGLIRDIHIASERKRRVVGDLVRLVRDLGSLALAEGVETEAEAEVCREMGFQLIQGYLTGKPAMLPKT